MQEKWDQTAYFTDILNRTNRSEYLTGLLGLTLTAVESDRVTGEYRPTDAAVNPYGIAHGGALYTIMDQVAGIAACTTGDAYVTLNSTADFFQTAALGETFFCVGETVKRGKTVTVCDAVVRNGEGKLIARGSFTYYNKGPIENMVKDIHA